MEYTGGARVGTLSLVGDVMLQTSFASQPWAKDPRFRAVLDELSQTDVVVANLEMPLSRRGSKMLKHSNLRSDPAIIEDVRAMGIHAVTLANNHMMDYGPLGLLDTVKVCDRAGLLHCGAGANLDAALAPAWLDVAGQRVALVSVASTLPLGSEASETTAGIAPLRISFSFEIDTNLLNEQPGTMPIVHTWTRAQDQDATCRLIGCLAAQADAVAVAIHWGVPTYWLSPFQGLLAEYQQPLGRALIDAGADIVFGHHSHSLHGIEIYHGRPIFYSVGNFLYEQPRGFMQPESMIAQCTFGDRRSVQVVPLRLDERGLPHAVTGTEAGQVIERLAELSAPFGTQLEPRGDRVEVVID